MGTGLVFIINVYLLYKLDFIMTFPSLVFCSYLSPITLPDLLFPTGFLVDPHLFHLLLT